MKIELRSMIQSEFEVFMARSVPDYAKDKMVAENLTHEEALEKSQAQFNTLLPDGLKTKNNYFYTFTDQSQKSIGCVWLAARDKDVFIYDLYLDQNQRGKGLGAQMMQLIDEQVKQLGFDAIRLHVFGHNKVAIKLYQSAGYTVTNMHMMKKL